MPIYAYKCESCGFSKDVLQKMSDTPLSECLQCGKSTFKKQLTAAGFQLKGSGWYVTDFRGGSTGEAPSKPADTPATSSDPAPTGNSPAAPAALSSAGSSVAASPATSASSAAPSGASGGTSSTPS